VILSKFIPLSQNDVITCQYIKQTFMLPAQLYFALISEKERV